MSVACEKEAAVLEDRLYTTRLKQNAGAVEEKAHDRNKQTSGARA